MSNVPHNQQLAESAPLPVQDVRPAAHKFTAAEIRADVNLIQEVMKAVMKRDVHFGVVPGTDKPTLLKPGAEKLMVTFRLNAEPVIEDLSGADEIRYRIKVRITHQITKAEIGWGVGECSSNETKYKWMRPTCKEEYDATPDDRRRIKFARGQGGKIFKNEQIRTNLSDAANTVLKMAKKRALVDAILTCTAASDIFTQDVEDVPEEMADAVADARPARTAPRETEAATAAQAPAGAPAPSGTGRIEAAKIKFRQEYGISSETIDAWMKWNNVKGEEAADKLVSTWKNIRSGGVKVEAEFERFVSAEEKAAKAAAAKPADELL
jgi:hypothetical protein